MERKSNIELLRLSAMLLVLLLHANYFSLGAVGTSEIQVNPYTSFIKVFFEQACIICVNVFILISGWFGIKPSLKGGISFLFQVFFYHTIIILFALCMNINVPQWMIIETFYFGYPYWFVRAYFLLYILSPILNTFIENTTHKMYFTVLVSFFMTEFLTGWIYPDFMHGYSTISFIGLYLLARFVRIYPIRITKKQYLLIYILLTLIPVILFYITKRSFNMLSYLSPFVVFASLFFFLAFSKLNIKSKLINYLACSSFSIYLIHLHPLISPYYKELMNTMYSKLGGLLYVVFVVIFAIIFGLSCIMIDKIRIITWKFLCKHIFNNLLFKTENLYNKLYLYLQDES